MIWDRALLESTPNWNHGTEMGAIVLQHKLEVCVPTQSEQFFPAYLLILEDGFCFIQESPCGQLHRMLSAAHWSWITGTMAKYDSQAPELTIATPFVCHFHDISESDFLSLKRSIEDGHARAAGMSNSDPSMRERIMDFRHARGLR